MGASEADTFVCGDRLRRWLIIFGLASVITMLFGIWVAVDRFPTTTGSTKVEIKARKVPKH